VDVYAPPPSVGGSGELPVALLGSGILAAAIVAGVLVTRSLRLER
jgi:hypothetical protein